MNGNVREFRVITDGSKFRVQEKGWFKWRTLGRSLGYGGFEPYEFDSWDKADSFIQGLMVPKIATGWRTL